MSYHLLYHACEELKFEVDKDCGGGSQRLLIKVIVEVEEGEVAEKMEKAVMDMKEREKMREWEKFKGLLV
ncbi:hypothetical protein SESBI_06390 [Sesbania bispinosa]|nr:hypothetical protein SESBI_06390 [Sesbania bispinosa]